MIPITSACLCFNGEQLATVKGQKTSGVPFGTNHHHLHNNSILFWSVLGLQKNMLTFFLSVQVVSTEEMYLCVDSAWGFDHLLPVAQPPPFGTVSQDDPTWKKVNESEV